MASGLLFRKEYSKQMIYTSSFKNGYLYFSDNIQPSDINESDLFLWKIVPDLIPDFHWKLNDNYTTSNLTNKYFSDSGKYGSIMISGHTDINAPTNFAIIYQSLNFGSGDYLYSYVPNNMDLSAFTFTCWISPYIDSLTSNTLFNISSSDGNKITVKYNYTKTPYLQISGVTNDIVLSGTNNFVLNTTGWTFLAVCYDAMMYGEDVQNLTGTKLGVVDFYVCVNGRGGYSSDSHQESSIMKTQYNFWDKKNAGWIKILANDKIYLGASGYTNPKVEYRGYMEDVRFYCNRFLSLNEISSIYNEGVGTYQQTYKNYPTIRHPIHWYKFQEKKQILDNLGYNLYSDAGLLARFLSGGTSSSIFNVPITGNTSSYGNTFPYHQDWTTCVDFTSINAQDRTSVGLSGYTQYSISFWAKITSGGDGTYSAWILRSVGINWSLRVYASIDTNQTSEYYFYVGGVWLMTSSRVNNDWHHFVITYNKNSLETIKGFMYIDGVVNQTTTSTAGIVGENGIWVGDGGGATLKIFDLRIFDYQLTQNEAEQLWHDNMAIMY